jgi:hypothetical protein
MSFPFPDRPLPRWFVRTAAVLLLAVFAVLCGHVARTTSPTFDEPDQVAVGYASLTQGPKHTYSVINLRLSQIWAALPLLTFERSPAFPSREQQDRAAFEGIKYGRLFLFANGNDPEAILFASRATIILLGLWLGALLFVYSSRLHGDTAGLLTLVFYCLSPLVIANSSLATTEIATTLLFTLSSLAIWRLLHRLSAGTVLGAGVAVGALAATKISGLLIVPIAFALLVIRLRGGRPLEIKPPRAPFRETRPAPGPLLGALLVSALVAWAVVWAVYGGPAAAPPANPVKWTENLLRPAHFSAGAIAWCREWRLLPDAYLYDLHLFVDSGSGRRAFLLGDYSLTGWWYFFPVAWLVKNPLPFLVALLAAGAVAWQGRRRPVSEGGVDFYGLAPVLVSGLVYGCFAICGNLNIGARHLLPVFPLALVFAGLAYRLPLPGARLRAWFLAALIVGSALEAGLIHPQHLAYFNLFAGGPERGWRVLSDSSADWGESLPQVQRWMKRRAARGDTTRIHFSYFGCADLAHYGIDDRTAVLLPQYYDTRPIRPYALTPGVYVISTTMLNRIYNGDFMGPWRQSHETLYQERLRDMARLQEIMRDPAAAQTLMTGPEAETWSDKINDFDYLSFNRLCAYLIRREPDERITYGMLVYRVSQEDLQAALYGAPAEMGPPNAIKGADQFTDEQLLGIVR